VLCNSTQQMSYVKHKMNPRENLKIQERYTNFYETKTVYASSMII